jgi:hypothetical protein
MKRRYIVIVLVAVLVVAAVVYLGGGGHSPAGQPPLETLTAANVQDIKTEFNGAKGDARVLLLLSPT